MSPCPKSLLSYMYFRAVNLPVIRSTKYEAASLIEDHIIDGCVVAFLYLSMSKDGLHSFKAGNFLIFKIFEGINRKFRKMKILSLKVQILRQPAVSQASIKES